MKNRMNMNLRDVENLLKEYGVQASAQRIAICHHVLTTNTHPTVDDVKAWADDNFPKMSLATVYNTLNLLSDVGLLKTLKFPHSDKAHFDGDSSAHFHFLDEETGTIYDIPSEKMQYQLDLPKGFILSEVDFLVKGKYLG
ncbi:MAG: Fur family transcriptional regulator [Candidatus Cloacimonadota bacterium]|nr:MAG: Fur family transcriptional regulator [Candidatus Cloacimonadota bacterium]